MPRIVRSTVEVEALDIIDQYTVADGYVSVQVTGDGWYLVEEPPFQQAAGSAYEKIMDKMQETMPA